MRLHACNYITEARKSVALGVIDKVVGSEREHAPASYLVKFQTGEQRVESAEDLATGSLTEAHDRGRRYDPEPQPESIGWRTEADHREGEE
jgi:hypothetical protein